MTFTYSYLYLKDVLQTERVIFFYRTISTIFPIATIIASLIFGKMFDRLRNLRQILVLCNIMISLGNLLYCIPLSPWLLFFERFLAGIGASSEVIMSGETIRCYTGYDVILKVTMLCMTFGVGFIVGTRNRLLFFGN